MQEFKNGVFFFVVLALKLSNWVIIDGIVETQVFQEYDFSTSNCKNKNVSCLH